jgi:hypothetical protein
MKKSLSLTILSVILLLAMGCHKRTDDLPIPTDTIFFKATINGVTRELSRKISLPGWGWNSDTQTFYTQAGITLIDFEERIDVSLFYKIPNVNDLSKHLLTQEELKNIVYKLGKKEISDFNNGKDGSASIFYSKGEKTYWSYPQSDASFELTSVSIIPFDLLLSNTLQYATVTGRFSTKVKNRNDQSDIIEIKDATFTLHFATVVPK